MQRIYSLALRRRAIFFCLLMGMLFQGCALFKDSCPDGLTLEGQGCIKKPATCGYVCFQPGAKNCDITHPTAVCTTVTNAAGACDCKCM